MNENAKKWLEEKHKNNIPVEEAARRMGVSSMYIRIGLQRKLLPFGFAQKVNSSRWTYYINPAAFDRFLSGEMLEILTKEMAANG